MAASKTVLITGATRGIGLTFVRHYVAEGWRVLAAARDPSTSEQLRALAPHKIVQLDVTDEASIVRAATELEGECIDVLINNAGVLWRETLDNTEKANVMKQFEVNAVGPFLVARAFLPHLKAAAAASGFAKIANLSSILGSITENKTGGLYGYRASKAALNMINATLALDIKAHNIASLVYHPGYVATDMNSHQGTVQPVDSVAGLTKLIGEATLEDSGKYFEYSGRALPW